MAQDRILISEKEIDNIIGTAIDEVKKIHKKIPAAFDIPSLQWYFRKSPIKLGTNSIYVDMPRGVTFFQGAIFENSVKIIEENNNNFVKGLEVIKQNR